MAGVDLRILDDVLLAGGPCHDGSLDIGGIAQSEYEFGRLVGEIALPGDELSGVDLRILDDALLAGRPCYDGSLHLGGIAQSEYELGRLVGEIALPGDAVAGVPPPMDSVCKSPMPTGR